jgi:quinol monooxygenase YgiN
MFIYTLLYKCKPDTDANEINRLYNELAIPIMMKLPGCISANIHKYLVWNDNISDWEYVYVELWENKEAYDMTFIDKHVQVGKTGVYDKFFSIVEKSFGFYSTPIE